MRRVNARPRPDEASGVVVAAGRQDIILSSGASPGHGSSRRMRAWIPRCRR